MMGCCDEVKKVVDKAGNIAKGWTNYLLGRDMVYTKAALYACKQCKHNRFVGIRGICAICHCWIPAKTRVPLKSRTVQAEDGSMVAITERVEECKLGKWPPLPDQAKSGSGQLNEAMIELKEVLDQQTLTNQAEKGGS